jgi:hypothetical protein
MCFRNAAPKPFASSGKEPRQSDPSLIVIHLEKLGHARLHFFAVLRAVSLHPQVLMRAARLHQIVQILRVWASTAKLRDQRTVRKFSKPPAALHPIDILAEDLKLDVVVVQSWRVRFGHSRDRFRLGGARELRDRRARLTLGLSQRFTSPRLAIEMAIGKRYDRLRRETVAENSKYLKVCTFNEAKLNFQKSGFGRKQSLPIVN